MRPTPLHSLALVAAAMLALSGCASKKDPTADTMTTATGLGQFGEPVAVDAGLGAVPSPGYDTSGGGTTTGAIDGTALGGVGQAGTGTYGANNGLVDGGIISAAPQYADGTLYTDNTVYQDTTANQPFDSGLFDGTGTAAGSGGSQFTTYSDQGGASLDGYSFPGDNGQPSYFTTQVGNRVLFSTDSVILTDTARETLRRQAAWLQLHPEHTGVVLEGHADERGTREYNLALGARRADAVRAYMTSLGVAPSRLRTVSYGKERPISLGSNPSDWAKNRRVETVLGSGASF